MATTSFQAGGYPGRPYGSFAGREPFVPPVVTATETGGGIPAAKRRRRYILPDGTNVWATRQEVETLLDRFALARSVIEVDKTTGKVRPRVRATLKGKPSELVEFAPLKSDDEAFRVKLPKAFRWAPDENEYALALANLDDDEEDDIITMLLLH